MNEELGVIVEADAGPGAPRKTVYSDLVETSLVVGARFLVLGVMAEYRHQSNGREASVASYREARDMLDAVFASQRPGLPFEGSCRILMDRTADPAANRAMNRARAGRGRPSSSQ